MTRYFNTTNKNKQRTCTKSAWQEFSPTVSHNPSSNKARARLPTYQLRLPVEILKTGRGRFVRAEHLYTKSNRKRGKTKTSVVLLDFFPSKNKTKNVSSHPAPSSFCPNFCAGNSATSQTLQIQEHQQACLARWTTTPQGRFRDGMHHFEPCHPDQYMKLEDPTFVGQRRRFSPLSIYILPGAERRSNG